MGAILIILILTLFSSVKNYFNNTYLTNLIYIIPYETKISLVQVITRTLFRPILIFTLQTNEQFYFILKFISLWHVISLILLFIKNS